MQRALILQTLIEQLTGQTMSIDEAVVLAADGGLPKSNGVYCWWIFDNALPGFIGCEHPNEQGLRSLYVGIAPKDAMSSSTLRDRVRGNHCMGNTGSSTLRFTLASLLFEQSAWRPNRRKKKYVLSNEQNRELSDWQRAHLRLTWAHCDRPWECESQVIAALEPPLNVDGNWQHPCCIHVESARARFRMAAQ